MKKLFSTDTVQKLSKAVDMQIEDENALLAAIEVLLNQKEAESSMPRNALFSNYKYCKACKKPMSLDYVGDTCPMCMEQELFAKVKDFIRANEVNEYQVAQKFDIPVIRVKGWIREGRIQYKSKEGKKIVMHCQICGAEVEFGSLCSKCIRKKDMFGTLAVGKQGDAEADMRFLDY